MTNNINCSSCGASNQLPEEKNSMFCAFCGNAIERNKEEKISKPENPLNTKPEISKKKIEPVSVFKPNYGNSYYEEKLSVTDQGGELILINRGITSLNDIIVWFSDNELNEIRVLNLSDNKINSLEGIQRFNSLEILNVSNNNITSLEHLTLLSANNISINRIILSNNKITSLKGIKNFECRNLDISNNLITILDDIPRNKQFDIVNLDNNPNLSEFSEDIKDRIYGICLALNGCNKFNYSNILDLIKRRNRINIWIWVKKGDKLPNELYNVGFEKNQQNEPIYDYYRYPGFSETSTKNIKSNNNKPSFGKLVGNELSGGKCFIATATMGSYDHPQVMELRDFRDYWILQKRWGEGFVKWYYHYGAIAAKFIEKSFVLKKICYLLIVKPLVYFARIVKFK